MGSLGLARYLGDGFATHLRSGMYGDSWGVGAWIPEAAITKEFGQRVLADVHARWYSQTGATFFEHHYEDLAEHMTADIRLSSLTERAVGTYAAVVLLPASEPAGALSLNLSYERSWLDYREHVVSDPRYYRPAEVELLLAEPAKAHRELGWRPKMSFEQLVTLMVDADLARLSAAPRP